MKIVIAGFYRPPILAIRQLFSCGISANDILLLTYGGDDDDDLGSRNRELISFAEDQEISYTTDPITDESVRRQVEAFDPDVLFSLYYRDKIPMSILDSLPYGGVNLHASLLPKHRGRFPVSYALWEGDETTGFTYHYMTEEFDQGRIVLQESVPIEPDDTAYSLYHRLIYAALRRFLDVYEKVVVEEVSGTRQTGSGSYHSELPNANEIDPTWSDECIERFIRAMYFPPYRPATVTVNGEEHEVVNMAQYREVVGER